MKRSEWNGMLDLLHQEMLDLSNIDCKVLSLTSPCFGVAETSLSFVRRGMSRSDRVRLHSLSLHKIDAQWRRFLAKMLAMLSLLSLKVSSRLSNCIFMLILNGASLFMAAVMSVSASAQTDSLSIPLSSVEVMEYKQKRLSPSQVTLYSALIPTFGQFYNRAYWKVPVFLGLGGWFAYNFARQNNLYATYRDRYQNDLKQTPVPPNAEFNRRLRDFYRGQRDEFAVYVVLVYALSILDAYIDAHLFDFDTSDVLTLAPPISNSPTLTLFQLNMPF